MDLRLACRRERVGRERDDARGGGGGSWPRGRGRRRAARFRRSPRFAATLPPPDRIIRLKSFCSPGSRSRHSCKLPALLAWFREDRLLLLEISEPDGIRCASISCPRLILYSLPALAAALLMRLPATSIGRRGRHATPGAQVPDGRRHSSNRPLGDRVPASGAEFGICGAAALRLMADAPPADTAGAVAWIQRHERSLEACCRC